MNNKCGCGWDQGCQSGNGFVPVTGNWDFNMDGGCQRQRQNRCNTCEKEENTYRRTRQAECCEHTACEKNAYTRRTDCACERADYREDVCKTCGKTRNACTCGQKDYARTECCEERTAPACVMKHEKPACGYSKKGVGMVRVTKQALGDIFDNARALKAGTLFPELHKPMNGYCPCDEECGDNCQQAAFAAWELRLYLDTHPDDKQALALLNQITGDCCEPNYATTFLTEKCSRWVWTDDPWPWNMNANCCK